MKKLLFPTLLLTCLTSCIARSQQPINTTESTSKVQQAETISVSTNDSPYQMSEISKADSATILRILCNTPKECKTREQIIIWIARQFLGVPYVAHTLDRTDNELMVINLHELDCTTYVEVVAALSRCVFQQKKDIASFVNELRNIRYRNGEVSYETRNHYFQWWVEANTKNSIAEEVFAQNDSNTSVAQVYRTQTINNYYMTQHSDSYDMLRNHPERVESIKQQEIEHNGAKVNYIPANQIKNTQQMRQLIHDGDIIGLVTTKDGLDASHLGIAVWHKDGLHFLNASSLKKNGKSVVESKESFIPYLNTRPTDIGIRCLRLK